MTNRNPDFLGRQSTGDRGIYVAHDDHPIRPLLQARFLIRDHDTTRLLRMSAAAYPQMDVGVGKAELPQESARHIGVVVLPGMDETGSTP